MVFSTNQSRQMYVVNGEASAAIKSTTSALSAATTGSILPVKNEKEDLYIIQKGFGGLVRSDILKKESILWAKASAPKDSEIKLKSYKVEVNGDLVSGQDYILKVNISQAFSLSDEDIYQKEGMVHAYSSMTKAEFYTKLAASLIRNFKRVYSPFIEVSNGTSVGVRVSVDSTGNYKIYDAAGSVVNFTNCIYVNEASQVDQWALGVAQYSPVNFTLSASSIFVAGEETNWAKITDNTATYNTSVPNGYTTADLEYFCMGERGDQYRNISFPNAVPTKYMADATGEYYFLDIHYAYQGANHASQKSEKTLTIAAKDVNVIEAIVTKFGITVEKTANYTDAVTE